MNAQQCMASDNGFRCQLPHHAHGPHRATYTDATGRQRVKTWVNRNAA